METNAQFQKFAEAIADQIRPAIPISVDLWDLRTIAAYLKVSKSQAQRYAARTDFPKATRLPTDGRGTPRYKAKAVIAWAERFTEKN